MENFLKINSLIKELTDELNTLKEDIENDMNYSSDHAEMVTAIEHVEEKVADLTSTLKDIEEDINVLTGEIDNSPFDDDDDDNYDE